MRSLVLILRLCLGLVILVLLGVGLACLIVVAVLGLVVALVLRVGMVVSVVILALLSLIFALGVLVPALSLVLGIAAVSLGIVGGLDLGFGTIGTADVVVRAVGFLAIDILGTFLKRCALTSSGEVIRWAVAIGTVSASCTGGAD